MQTFIKAKQSGNITIRQSKLKRERNARGRVTLYNDQRDNSA